MITSVKRRRRWSWEEKERLVAASFEPGVTTSQVARVAGIHASQLFRWRKQLCERVAVAGSERAAIMYARIRQSSLISAVDLDPPCQLGSHIATVNIDIKISLCEQVSLFRQRTGLVEID